MSRLIIKNLPNGVGYPSESHHPVKVNSAWATWKRECFLQMKEERFKSMFAAFGTVTDCSLKFTKDGKFRKFGFVGFRSEEEANRALKHLNKSFVDTSRVTVYTNYLNIVDGVAFRFCLWSNDSTLCRWKYVKPLEIRPKQKPGANIPRSQPPTNPPLTPTLHSLTAKRCPDTPKDFFLFLRNL